MFKYKFDVLSTVRHKLSIASVNIFLENEGIFPVMNIFLFYLGK